MDKYIGRLLDNRYEILEVLGTGGMAVVYKARCHRLNRLVAIKILKDDYLEDEEFRRRFHAESQAVAMLSHPNIVAVYDVSTSNEADYIVMELIDGITLKQYMEKKGVLNWKETLHFAIQIAKALEHAHSRGVVHRDIKPHNIMVLKNGSVKVADFGIARLMSKGNTLTKEALGSVHYISPEQAKGGRVDNRSDIYSLGVVMYEMMSGRPPYDGESPVAVAIQHINGGAIMPSILNPNIPGGLEQIIMKAMAHSIEDRYESTAGMLRDMDEFRKDPSILFDYNAPPLDAVTKLQRQQPEENSLAARTTAERMARKQEGNRRRTPPRKNEESGKTEEKPAQRKAVGQIGNSRTATIAIIACSVVMVVAIVICMVVLFGNSSSEPLLTVPSLIGKDYDSLIEPTGFKIKLAKSVYDANTPAGQIIDQNPEAGDEVAKGNTIFVTVSKGPEPKPVLMPGLPNLNQSVAKATLEGLKLQLTVDIREEYNDLVPVDYVIRTEPTANAELTQGQKVTLYVSKGPETKTAQMPMVTDIIKTSAVKTLENQDLDLKIEIQDVYDAVVEVGVVIRTEPAAGADLSTGQTVTLFVSKGPQTVKMPQLIDAKIEDAKKELEALELKNIKVEEVFSDKAVGVVVKQSVDANTDVITTTQIVLTVSKGQEPVKKIVAIPLPAQQQEKYELIITRWETNEVVKKITVDPAVETGETMNVELEGSGKQVFEITVESIESSFIRTVAVDFAMP